MSRTGPRSGYPTVWCASRSKGGRSCVRRSYFLRVAGEGLSTVGQPRVATPSGREPASLTTRERAEGHNRITSAFGGSYLGAILATRLGSNGAQPLSTP